MTTMLIILGGTILISLLIYLTIWMLSSTDNPFEVWWICDCMGELIGCVLCAMISAIGDSSSD